MAGIVFILFLFAVVDRHGGDGIVSSNIEATGGCIVLAILLLRNELRERR